MNHVLFNTSSWQLFGAPMAFASLRLYASVVKEKWFQSKAERHLQCLLYLHREMDRPLHLKTDEFWWPPTPARLKNPQIKCQAIWRGSCSKPTVNFLPTMVLRLTNKSLQSSWAGWNIVINGIFISNGAGFWFVSNKLTLKKNNKLQLFVNNQVACCMLLRTN